MEQTFGEAYGFFYCEASAPEIKAQMPFIREKVQTPSALELTLIEGPENLLGDDSLKELAKEAKGIGMNYVLKARYPGASNERTASETGDILNGIYLTFFNQEEEFWAEIFYKNDQGEYVRKEE